MPITDIDYLTVTQCAERFGVTDSSIRRWIAQGRLPAYRLGSQQLRVRADDLDAILVPVPTSGGPL